MSSFKKAQQRVLERRLNARIAQYEALELRALDILNPADHLNIQHQIEHLLNEIPEIEAELAKVTRELNESSLGNNLYSKTKSVAKIPTEKRELLYKQTAGFLVGVLAVLITLRLAVKLPNSTICQDYRDFNSVHVEESPLALCSDSVEEWMNLCLAELRKQGAHIEGNIVPEGSRDAKQSILYKPKIVSRSRGGSYKLVGRPLVYLPDDEYWQAKLDSDWKNIFGANFDVVNPNTAVVLMHSRLVLVMHRKRAEEFKATLERDEYKGKTCYKTWQLLHDIALRGWQFTNKQETDLQRCRIYIGDPSRLHSGLAALTLIYAEYAREKQDKSVSAVDDRLVGFIKTLTDSATNAEFNSPFQLSAVSAGQSGSIGPDDIAIGYEADIYRALSHREVTDLDIIYPDPTLDIRFNAALLQGTLSAGKKTITSSFMAGNFIDYLLAPESQSAALSAGFRPEKMPSGSTFFPDTTVIAGFGKEKHTVKLNLISNVPCKTEIGNGTIGRLTVDPRILADLPYVWNSLMARKNGLSSSRLITK